MDTMKIIGYAVSVAGLGIIALSTKISKLLSFLGTKANLITIVAGLILVVVGVVLITMLSDSFGSPKVKHAEAEVPIYEGKGKNRKIVGYQKGED